MFRVVDATPADIDKMVEISRVTQREHASRLPEHFAAEDATASEKILPLLLEEKAGKGAAYALFDGDRLVGHAGFVILDIPAPGNRHERSGSVYDISILPEARAAGGGRLLLATLIEDAKSRGITVLGADIWAGNEASSRLFSGFGFEPRVTEHRLRLLEPIPSPPKSAGWLSTQARIWLPALPGLLLVFVVTLAANFILFSSLRQ